MRRLYRLTFLNGIKIKIDSSIPNFFVPSGIHDITQNKMLPLNRNDRYDHQACPRGTRIKRDWSHPLNHLQRLDYAGLLSLFSCLVILYTIINAQISSATITKCIPKSTSGAAFAEGNNGSIRVC